MRAPCGSRAAAICGALAMALACSVETEGAPCSQAGAVAECPGGQACGNDLRCSARALACRSSRCEVGAVACRDRDGQECTNADPVCGAWSVLPTLACTSVGLECQGAAERCDCPAAGPIFEVDGTNVNPTDGTFGSVTPTGAPSNGACRFATLTAALEAAGAYAADPSHDGTATVRALVDPEGGFGPAAGDALPIVVPPGVTLQSEDVTSPASSVITTDATVATAMVRLDAGAAIAGFTLRNQLAVPDATSAGFGVESDAGGTVSNVLVETNNLACGVRVTGSAPATLVDVRANGPRRAALWIDTAAGVLTDIVGGSFTAARGTDVAGGHGIWIRGGSVSIRSHDAVTFSPVAGVFSGGAPVDVSGSTGSGVRIEKGTASTPVALTVERARIATNGAAGIYAFNVANGTTLTVLSSSLEGNNATNPTTYFSPLRAGGGIVLVASQATTGLTLTVRGSRVWRNAGDQIGIDVPDVADAYDISGGAACGGTSNVLGSCSATAEDVFSTTDTTLVPAQQNYWQGAPRVTNADYQPVCAWTPPTCP